MRTEPPVTVDEPPYSEEDMMNLLDIYTALARERPDEPALIFEREPYVGIRLSWVQLAARGEELSLRLAAAGIGRQSLCAVELADHPDTLPLLLGIWRLGVTALLVDPKCVISGR